MRSMVFAVSLTLAGASVSQAQEVQSLQPRDMVPQQVVVAAPAKKPDVKAADAPIGMTRSKAGVDAVKSNAVAEPSAVDMDPGTRNILAIVGLVVIVIALVSFVL